MSQVARSAVLVGLLLLGVRSEAAEPAPAPAPAVQPEGLNPPPRESSGLQTLSPAPPPAWGTRGRSYFRFEGGIGPALVGVFPQNPPPPDPPELEPSWMPAPNSCGAGGQVTLGFRHVSPYRPYAGGLLSGLLKIPVLGWILAVPLIPILMLTSSVVSGDQMGVDLRFAIWAPCGNEGVRYAVGLRPVLATGRADSRVRLPAVLGMVLPEPLVVFEANQAVMLELGLLRFPVGVLLTEHLGIEIEPSLGYRVSFAPGIPSAVTLGIGARLVLR